MVFLFDYCKNFVFLLAVAYVWIIQNLILMIKMTCKRKWMPCLGWTRQCKKNWKQHHIKIQSKFLPCYLINGLECTVQNILISLNTLFELYMKSKNVGEILAKPAPEKRKSYHQWNTSSSNKRFWRWQFQYVGAWKERLC